MPKLIDTWVHGHCYWTSFLTDDGVVGVHCRIAEPTAKEITEAYTGIPMMQRHCQHGLAPGPFSLESDDPMILAIAREHGVCIQACPVSDSDERLNLWNTFDV